MDNTPDEFSILSILICFDGILLCICSVLRLYLKVLGKSKGKLQGVQELKMSIRKIVKMIVVVVAEPSYFVNLAHILSTR